MGQNCHKKAGKKLRFFKLPYSRGSLAAFAVFGGRRLRSIVLPSSTRKGAEN